MLSYTLRCHHQPVELHRLSTATDSRRAPFRPLETSPVFFSPCDHVEDDDASPIGSLICRTISFTPEVGLDDGVLEPAGGLPT